MESTIGTLRLFVPIGICKKTVGTFALALLTRSHLDQDVDGRLKMLVPVLVYKKEKASLTNKKKFKSLVTRSYIDQFEDLYRQNQSLHLNLTMNILR